MNTSARLLKKIFVTVLSMISFAVSAGAQTAMDPVAPASHPVEIPKALFDPDFWIVFLVACLLLFVIISLAHSVHKLSNTMHVFQKQEVTGKAEVRVTAWKKLMTRLTRSVPVEHEKDVMLDHDYDGIRELDNKLPPWWVYGFYVTIVIAVIYIFNYHIAKTSRLQIAEYNAEMSLAEADKAARAKIASNNITPENVVALKDPVSIAAGKEIFTKNCVACHGNLGQGNVGPNFTDKYWIHGGGIKNIFTTITNGVPAKGMISWKSQLAPSQIQRVASFILTLEGTNPAGAKEPQGDLYIETAVDSVGKTGNENAKADSAVNSKLKL